MKVGVVAHVSREVRANKLIEDVQAEYYSFDDGKLGCLLNHRRVWNHLERLVTGDDWGLVLEDDAVLCTKFRPQAEAALSRVPKGVDVVSFYLGQGWPPQWVDPKRNARVPQAVAAARANDVHWIVGDVVLHGVALAIRGPLISKMLIRTVASPRPLDEAMTQWCRCFGHDVAYTWPSLVDHADESSVMVHPDHEEREKGRVAWQFGTRPYWTSRAVVL